MKLISLIGLLVAFAIVLGGFEFIFSGHEILGPFLVLVGAVVTVGAVRPYWKKPLTLLGLLVFIGGTLASLYLIYGRCSPEGGLLPNGMCYVYASNNLWFATDSIVAPLLGLVLLVASYERYGLRAIEHVSSRSG